MSATLSEVCAKALQLPCSPVFFPRLLEVLDRPEAGLEELEEVLSLDAVLAAGLLRLANSAYFAGADLGVATLHEAVMRLGLREIYRLAALSLAGRWMTYPTDGYGWSAGDFCRASLVEAVAAEVLAERSGRVEPKTAYAAGLVHSIGKLAIAYACPESFGAIREHQRAHGVAWLEAERAVLGFDHAQVSAELLRRWKFPAGFVAVAEQQPPTAAMPVDDRPLAVHVHAAQYLACVMGPGQGEDGFLFNLQADLLAAEGLSADVLMSALPVVLERASRLLREKLTHGPLEL